VNASVELTPSSAVPNLILTPPIEPVKANQIRKGFVIMDVRGSAESGMGEDGNKLPGLKIGVKVKHEAPSP